MNVRLQTKWLWVQIPLLSLNHSIIQNDISFYKIRIILNNLKKKLLKQNGKYENGNKLDMKTKNRFNNYVIDIKFNQITPKKYINIFASLNLTTTP